MTLADALAVAGRLSGRPSADVRSAKYFSAMELKARLAEDPRAAQDLVRFEPHWRIQFAGRETITDEGQGPMYVLTLELSDDVLVFGDGCGMTFFEVTKGA